MTDRSEKSDHAVEVRLENVSKRFGDLVAVDDVSLTVRPGSFCSLLGPSGCGKSTTLRIISGFEEPESGRVLIDSQDVTGVEARRRPTAMVFQNYALFPHMTVGENVAYGLKVRKHSKSEIDGIVADSLRRVDLSGFRNTQVTSLSGGQQQRTALARAIAIEPKVILFDEPLSNLDVALRQQTRKELKQLQNRLGLTSIYVTHDQEEALALSDTIAVMRSGKIVQVGSPQELYFNPNTAFVASFLGSSNIVTDPSEMDRFSITTPSAGNALSIRPEHIEVSEGGSFTGEIVGRLFLGMWTELTIRTQGIDLTARIRGPVAEGSEVRFNVVQSLSVLNDVD